MLSRSLRSAPSSAGKAYDIEYHDAIERLGAGNISCDYEKTRHIALIMEIVLRSLFTLHRCNVLLQGLDLNFQFLKVPFLTFTMSPKTCSVLAVKRRAEGMIKDME